MKVRLVVVAILLCLCTPGCKAPNRLSSEARAAADRYWAIMLTDCGGKRFLMRGGIFSYSLILWNNFGPKDDNQITEFNDASTHVTDGTALNDVDKMNGFEWQGSTFMTAKTVRFANPKGGWSEYQDGPKWVGTPFGPISEGLLKKKGVWYYQMRKADFYTLDNWPVQKPIDCSKYPH